MQTVLPQKWEIVLFEILTFGSDCVARRANLILHVHPSSAYSVL